MSDVNVNNQKKVCETDPENLDGVSQEDIVDPRVQIELERLNTATDLINKLEIELDEARSHFRLLLSESSLRVNQLAKKLGSCVEKARPYYEARMRAKQLQTQTQKAALRYERASSAHAAAKEMVYLAEEGLKKEGRCFDPAWQEMLNHATLRVNEAESERVFSQHEHQKTSLAYNEAEKVVQQLHQELKKSIVKSRPYFEMKAQFNQMLEEQRKKVHHLEENVLKIKMSYADALHNLEEISDEIHQKRKAQESDSLCERSDCVGAESPSYMWDGLKMPYKFKSNSISSENIYLENINMEDMYMSLPAKLKVRPGIIETTCMGNKTSEAVIQKTPYLPGSLRQSLCQVTDEKVFPEKHFPNKVEDSSEKISNCIEENNTSCLYVDDSSSIISNQFKHLSLSDENLQYEESKSHASEYRDRSPEGEEMRDHKFLAADFNILRVQREEISDSESLASNDTADTLDDNQIECLLLDKMLPLDMQEIHVENECNSFKLSENSKQK